MRIITGQNIVGVEAQLQQGNVVFDNRREVRQYVLDMITRAAEGARAALPFPVRMLVSEQKLKDVLTRAFNRFWPEGGSIPA